MYIIIFIIKEFHYYNIYIMSDTMVHEVVAIMDRTGFIPRKVSDLVSGFNTMIDFLRTEQEENTIINVSVKLFDDEEIIIFLSQPLSDIRPLEERQCVARGQSALLDAIGNTIPYFIEKKLLDPTAYDCCTIYVVTNGIENCSQSFTKLQIKEIIHTAYTKYNIKVIYITSNQDAILEAGNIGINAEQAINYSETPDGTNAVYRGAAAMVMRHRCGDRFEFLHIERTASKHWRMLRPPLSSSRTPSPVKRHNCIHFQ
jgi:uncharacterized protein YegL